MQDAYRPTGSGALALRAIARPKADCGHHCEVRPFVVVVAVLAAVGAAIALWPRTPRHAADPCGAVDGRPSEIGLAAAERATVCLVNRERTQRGLTPLGLNPLLTSTSLEHSQDMVRRGYFEHSTPEGRTVGDRLRAVGYSRGASASAGENIAYGVGAKATPASIVRVWMHSPGHRADILRRAFTEIGIGIAFGTPPDPGSDAATYTTDFGGVVDPSLPNS
jgi:uncharacterized protein YkwD